MRAARTLLAAVGGCALVAAAVIHLAAGDISAAGWVLVGPAPFYLVGLVVAVRRPDLHIAIWLLATGVTFAVGVCLGNAVLPLVAHWPGAWMIGLLREWVDNAGALGWMAAIGLFPTGLPRGHGERWALRTGAVLAAMVPVLYAVSHHELADAGFDDPGAPSIASPLLVPAAVWSSTLTGGLFYLVEWVPIFAGPVMLSLRYRRSPSEDRRRIRWLLVGASLALAPIFSAWMLAWVLRPGSLNAFGVLVWPLVLVGGLGSLVIATMYDGVFGIDRPVRRSAVYRVLWLLIAVTYVAAAAALGVLASRYLPIAAAVMLATGAALLFQPAQRRMERLADRWVFGARLDGYQVLTRFGSTLETSPDPNQLLTRLADAVRQGLGLRWARVRLDLAVVAGPAPTGASGIGPEDPVEPDLVVPLSHGGTVLGRIECGPRRDGRLLDEDRRLLRHLAGQAATAVRNLHLTAQLSAQLEVIRRQADDLTASRARIARARDSERQRIQHDLHDGVQQELVVVTAKLTMARERLRRGDPRAEDDLSELQQDLAGLLASLREFAYRIHPPVLADQGLLEAIEAHVARMPLETVIEADRSLRGVRYPPHIESATWYVVAEALTNIVKHACARQAVVALSQPDHRLMVEVRDDGRGFDPAGTHGLGIAGLADRMSIVDGTLRVDSSPGAGTTLRAEIPLAGSKDRR